MLYVSRVVGRDKYLVMDTTDGVEQLATKEELVYCVNKLGIEIKGCEWDASMKYLSVYALSLSGNSKLAKLSVLKGVSLQIDGDTLVGLVITSTSQTTCSIRVSDYCKNIGDYVLSKAYRGDTTVILVLDNSVSVSKKAFKDYGLMNDKLLFDLSECSDENAFRVYDTLISDSFVLFRKNEPVSEANIHCIDLQRRREIAATKWLMIKKGFYRYDSADFYSYAKLYRKEMFNIYIRKVTALARTDVGIKEFSDRSKMLQYIKEQTGGRWREDSFFLDGILEIYFSNVVEMMTRITNLSLTTVRVMGNYIALWGFGDSFGNIYKTIARNMFTKLRSMY